MKKREREREGGERGRKKKKKEKQVQISQHLKWRQMKSLHNDHRGSSAASLMDFCVLKQNVFKLTKEGRERERMFSNRRESQHKHTLCVWGWKRRKGFGPVFCTQLSDWQFNSLSKIFQSVIFDLIWPGVLLFWARLILRTCKLVILLFRL